MGRKHVSELASLERLKALDSLQDLKSQLEVARSLCTHSARTEMVLRWLLERIKGSLKARTNVEAWSLFASTARLLSPERFATLLTPFDILGAVRSSLGAIEDMSLLRDVFIAISGCVNFLLDLASKPNGAAIKAYLSSQLSEATLFVGIWFLTLRKIICNTISPIELVLQHSLFEPGLRIWDLRKQSSDEEEHFSKNCLVETADLLLSLPVEKLNENSRKRKRSNDDLEQLRAYKHRLQKMLAKHIFLPARAAFFEGSRENETPEESRGSIVESDLVKKLKVLKNRDIKTPASEGLDPVQPALLDIALRCTPTLTPRQRLEEKSWNEVLFSALVDTFNPDGSQSSTKVVCAMLRIVHDRQSSLPINYLENLYQTYGRYAEVSSSYSSFNWQLVVEIINLAPIVYCGQSLAISLFDDMFKYTKDMIGELRGRDAEVNDLHIQWKENIIAPLMAAYAQNRNLIGFTDLWHRQLMRRWPAIAKPVWSLLDDVFAPLAARHLSEAQIVDLCTRYRLIFQSRAENHEDVEYRSSTIILHAILCSVTSSSLIDKLWEDFDELVHHIFGLHSHIPISQDLEKYPNSHSAEDQSTESIPPNYGHKWSLFRIVFELWFPLWVTRQPAREPINRCTTIILASRPVREAQKVVQESGAHTTATNNVNQTVADARRFLGALSDALIPYTRLDGKESELENRIAKFMPCIDVDFLLEHPDWLSELNADLRKDKILECINDAIKHISNGQIANPGKERIRAMIDITLTHSQADVLADLVDLCLTYIKREPNNQRQSTIGEDLVPIQILAEIPTFALTQFQRERTLNSLLTIEFQQANKKPIFEWCLIVMVHLLEFPCSNAQIFTDPDALWKFINNRCADTDLKEGQESSMNNGVSTLFVELIQRITNHLLGTQSQGQSRKVLIALYKKIIQYISTLSDDFATTESPTLLAIISVIMTLARALGKELSEECIDYNVLRKYAQVLLRQVKSLESHVELWNEVRSQGYLTTALRSLVPILDILGADKAIQDDFSAVVCSEIVTDNFVAVMKRMDQNSDELKRLIVRCLSRICRHIGFNKSFTSQKFTSLVVAILSTGLCPKAHADILQVFSQACEALDSRGRRQTLECLLSSSDQPHAMQLLCILLSLLRRLDFNEETNEMATSQDVFSHILHKAVRSENDHVRREACCCIILILREKSFMTNQYTIEATLALLHDSTRYERPLRLMYLDICRILTIILQQHRSRIKDRLDILVKVLQNLVSRLFHPKILSQSSIDLTLRQAKALARVLQLLCNPPQIHTRPKSSDLVDESRKAQVQAGRYLQYVLHHYCSQILSGTLAEGLRDALMPGLLAIVEAVEVDDRDGIKSLSAAMNSSERAVLRGIYNEYTLGRRRSE
ncbi:hypothetical protein M433DRAFT_7375 [Acidomyces richmondensis BFW]|nr:MAG: hypothetical protein FE78DRAFT_68898 [Acidomyces sp. 'richmondensis']KYG42161.1 hypothetical protein M433DRAFT_7375 [Acidomyces richmondensis BFW]